MDPPKYIYDPGGKSFFQITVDLDLERSVVIMGRAACPTSKAKPKIYISTGPC